MDWKLILTCLDMIIIGMALGYILGESKGYDEGKKIADKMWQKSFDDLLNAVSSAIKQQQSK